MSDKCKTLRRHALRAAAMTTVDLPRIPAKHLKGGCYARADALEACLNEALAILKIALPGPRPWDTEDVHAKLRIYRNMAEDRARG